MSVLPGIIAKSESTTVTCNATDPNGDILVYDWITDGRLRIRDALPGFHSVYNTATSSMVFYPDFVTPPDTCWVQCFARDGKGMSANRVVTFIVDR